MNNNTNTNTNTIQAFSILGEPASKSNSRRAVLIKGKMRFIKSQKALNYSSMFKQQCNSNLKILSGDVVIEIKIFYASRRPDLDESLILDLLQGVVYENDRQVKEKHIIWGLDKENPRAEIKVWER